MGGRKLFFTYSFLFSFSDVEHSYLPGSLHSVRTRENLDSVRTTILNYNFLSGRGYAQAGCIYTPVPCHFFFFAVLMLSGKKNTFSSHKTGSYYTNQAKFDCFTAVFLRAE